MGERWVASSWGAPSDWELVGYDAPAPTRGEVTIAVRAAGVNPADVKHVALPRPGVSLPVPIGYEVSGVISAVGPDTLLADGPGRPGDEVVAFRVQGGYATELTVPAGDVFRKPPTLTHPEAANLLLAGTTAAEMLDVVQARAGETVVVHGASGAVGVSVIQQAARLGVAVVGTSGGAGAARVRLFGGIPVRYGVGVVDRVRAATPSPIVAALDCVGTSESVDASLVLVADRRRIVTIAAATRAQEDGFRAIAGAMPESARFRNAARPRILALAAAGHLRVPMAATFPLAEARHALAALATGHPGGKLALVP